MGSFFILLTISFTDSALICPVYDWRYFISSTVGGIVISIRTILFPSFAAIIVLLIDIIVFVATFIVYDDSQIIHGSCYLCGIHSCYLMIHPCDLLKISILCNRCCSFCICWFFVLNGWYQHHLFWIKVNAHIFFWNIRVRKLILDKAFNFLQLLTVPVIFIFGSVLQMWSFPYSSFLDYFYRLFIHITTLSGMVNSLIVLCLKKNPVQMSNTFLKLCKFYDGTSAIYAWVWGFMLFVTVASLLAST